MDSVHLFSFADVFAQDLGLAMNQRIPKETSSLPEFIDFTLFGKTILVANKEFGLFRASPIDQK